MPTTKKNNLSRRDFLKLGGLSAIALPILKNGGELETSIHPEFQTKIGGFLIRQSAEDLPPYQINDDIYRRFDAKNTALGRTAWDAEIQQKIAAQQYSDVERIRANQAGFQQEDFALLEASWLAANISGTRAGMHGLHKGLLQLEPHHSGPINPETYNLSWDRGHLGEQEITQKIKKAAKFYGASLVGITKLDERWIYSHSFDIAVPEEHGEIIFTSADQIEIPDPEACKEKIFATLEAMEDDDLKDFIITTLEEIDPDILPPGAPSPFLVGTLPASQVAQMLPMMMDIMPEVVMEVIAQKLELPYGTGNIDPEALTRPHYLEDGTTLAIPQTMKWVIVIAFEIEEDAIATSSTAISAASLGNGYSRIASTASRLAEFIRVLGFNAIPCGDMTGLSIPMAIDAGLGELGRNGLLITPSYGPRVQLAKVITDLPLVADQPIHFGVAEFCAICNQCVPLCPGNAISAASPTAEPLNISNNPGVEKWPVDAEKCLDASPSDSAVCSTCIQVCPFNKPEGWLHDATRILVGAKNKTIDRLLLNLKYPYDSEEKSLPDNFWGTDRFIHTED